MKSVSAKSKLFPVAGDARHDRVTANLRLQASSRLSGWPQENVLAVRSSGWFRLDGGRHPSGAGKVFCTSSPAISSMAGFSSCGLYCPGLPPPQDAASNTDFLNRFIP